MKRFSFILGLSGVSYFVYKEFIHALEYIYNISLCRGDKAFFLNCNDLTNEKQVLDHLTNEIEETKKWEISTHHSNIFMPTDHSRSIFTRIYRQENYSKKWAIVVHGYGCTGQSMMICAKKFYENGFNVIVPDLPCHGNSYGNITGMGQYEYKEILKIADFIIKTDHYAEIMLYGVSMGAATILMATGENPPNICCAISDCSFTDARQIFNIQLQHFSHIPAQLIVHGIDKIYHRKTGLRLKNADVVESVKKSAIPTLFIHGDKDKVVPTYMVYDLFNAADCPKDIRIVKGAGHSVSSYIDKGYWKNVFRFSERFFD